eukprot:CAMPEP_0197181932 /NCGR_PEP_ID=MMETSP1423-20130617/6065_1 /TAXON_ID=476441 /ORGANISM="Pseudo-nitzschia heimii, Strain UNC1101" /LENGTH=393 /DNA_ID=CAMNT_0042632279 /DNA_START=116 /DNA_END=1297 /DNA_ORIENTATION=-
MKFSRTVPHLLAIAATGSAFVPKYHEQSLTKIAPTRPSVLLFAEKSQRDYLEDASFKEPDSYLEDMASTSGSVNGAKEVSDSRSNEYLNELAVEDTSGEPLGSENAPKKDEETVEGSNDDIETTLSSLLRIAASTGRGEFANSDQKEKAAELISVLEKNNPTPEPANDPMINGRWELVYSSSQLFRSSPFFMAGRAVCSTKEQADQYDWFCDMHRQALAISNIGTVRQVISSTLMISEFEVKVGAVPFLNDFTPFSYGGGLPLTIDGSIVSQADITPTEDGKAWELLMDTVQIKGSNIPGLRTILDNVLQLQSRALGSFLESNLDGYTNPRPIFETTYLTESVRISRDQDGKVFVYAKESDDSNSTDYGKVEADLGVLKLLGGFNDAVTKFYI